MRGRPATAGLVARGPLWKDAASTVAQRTAAFLLLALAAAPLALHAQSNDEIQTATQLNLSTPGARSLALGGAFVGVADDATAAYANPAGLGQLVAPEASLELRHWWERSRFTERGHAPQTALTGIGIDVVDGLQQGEIEHEQSAVSFASYVHPGRRFTWAVDRHQLADFRGELRTQGPFVGSRDSPQRLSPATSSLDLEIAGVGTSGAYRLRDDLLVGASLVYYDLGLHSRTERYARAGRTGNDLLDAHTGSFFGPADFSDGNVADIQTQDGDDHALTWSLGLLWRPSAKWSLGAVARPGADFDFRAEFTAGPASPQPGAVDPTLGGNGTFHVPDVYALGAAWRPAEPWLIAFDWTRVRYSELEDNLVNLLQAARGDLAGFQVDDADELHLGIEYQALSLHLPLSIRAGAWRDPDHKLRFTGHDAALRARFRPGSDDVHLAAGLGIVIGRFQLDAAYDHGDVIDTASLSGVCRF